MLQCVRVLHRTRNGGSGEILAILMILVILKILMILVIFHNNSDNVDSNFIFKRASKMMI